jgi:phosphoribosylglycinamide formyltransferase 1
MNIVILGSGRGSNAESILNAFTNNLLGQAKPTAIISDKVDAPILKLGNKFAVPSYYLDAGPFKTKLCEQGEQRYIDLIKTLNPDLIVLAGFMRVIKTPFLRTFPIVINLHPSLLPSFKGLNAIKQAWDYGAKITGCTVHLVTLDLDAGPILGQKAIPITKNDNLQSLETKIHKAEHSLLPEIIAQLSNNQFQSQILKTKTINQRL